LRGGERGEGSSASGPDSAGDSRAVYPCTLYHNGRLGGLYTLYADSAQVRTEWQEKLNHALTMRKAVQENNKVFEIETLSAETFLVPSMQVGAAQPSWNHDSTFTGKVTCSVPFSMSMLPIPAAAGMLTAW
jgi:RHO1 GDP-GTP exchange protein 1/2